MTSMVLNIQLIGLLTTKKLGTIWEGLMTKNTKAVCKIEGINYTLIRIREFLNPYLYRFFNITI